MSIIDSIRMLWHRPKPNDIEADNEIESIRIKLEDEIFQEHLKISNAVAEQIPGSDSDPDIMRKSDGSDININRQYILDYHNSFHKNLWFKTSDMTVEQRQCIADYLEILANNIGYRGMFIGNRELLDISAHLRNSQVQTSLLVEPWMSPFKLRKRDVRDLHLQLCNQAIGLAKQYEYLQDFYERSAGGHKAVKRAVNQFEEAVFVRFKNLVEKIAFDKSDLKAASVFRNMEYVLACSGDRGAMARMSMHLADLADLNPYTSTKTNSTKEDEIRQLIAQNWVRLSAAIASNGSNPFEVASERLKDTFIDLRYVDMKGSDTPSSYGLIVPSLSGSIVYVPYSRRKWQDDRYGEYKFLSPYPKTESPKATTMESGAVFPDGTVHGGMMSSEFAPNSNDIADKGDGGTPQANNEEEQNFHVLRDFLVSLGVDDNSVVSGHDGETAKSDGDEIVSDDPETTAQLVEELLTQNVRSAKSKPQLDSVCILDHVGSSETISRSEYRAEDSYAKLLSPLPLAVSALGADDIYDALQSEFPWMKEANKLVGRAAARSQRQKVKHFRLSPMLLVGPPGVGKTRWVRRVGELTGVPSHKMTLAGISHAKSIIGSERGWASARPSFMTYGFLNTSTANPIFHIDEVDKSTSAAHEPNVQDAFLPIIEKETAKSYQDIYLLGNLDLSWSSFLFTANDLSKVSAILLERMKIIHIEKPGQQHIVRIIDQMIYEFCENEDIDKEAMVDRIEDVTNQAAKIYKESGKLRDVQRHIEDELSRDIWSPKGLRLVNTDKDTF